MLKTAKKYLLAFSHNSSQKVFSLMEQMGSFEVVERKQEDIEQGQKENSQDQDLVKKIQEVDYVISLLDFALTYLKPFTKKVSLLAKLRNNKIAVKAKARDLSLEAIISLGKEGKLVNVAHRVEKIEKRISVLNGQVKNEEKVLSEMEKFGALDFAPQDTDQTFSLIIALPQNAQESFQTKALENRFFIKQLSLQQSKIFFLLIAQKQAREMLENILKEEKAEIINFTLTHSPQIEKNNAKQTIKEAEKELGGLKTELSLIAKKDSDNFKVLFDLLNIKKTQLAIKERALRDGFLSYVVFWGFDEDIKKLENDLKSQISAFNLIGLSKEENEEPPVVLKNNKLITPFQSVTEIFGMPRANEVDPTPYLAFFFILYFGICITDAGYGILLALLVGLPLLFLKNLFQDTKLLRLLFYGGISTFIIGVLFGGYFGASVDSFSNIPVLKELARLKKIDPIEDTILFMAIAFCLGYLQIFFSQIVKIISGAKNKSKSLIFNGASWALTYLFLATFLLGYFRYPAIKTIGLYGLIASGVLLLMAESIGTKIFLKPLVGAIKVLQGLIGTMSDVLSYSRLMALGLATGIIGLIINKIAFLFGGMIPFVGPVVAGLILVGGHIFNLGINALGGFIHSGRLQFVEFFPKFLEGGGRRFKPSKSQFKYIQVEQ